MIDLRHVCEISLRLLSHATMMLDGEATLIELGLGLLLHVQTFYAAFPSVGLSRLSDFDGNCGFDF